MGGNAFLPIHPPEKTIGSTPLTGIVVKPATISKNANAAGENRRIPADRPAPPDFEVSPRENARDLVREAVANQRRIPRGE